MCAFEMFSCLAIKIIKSTEAALRKLLPNTRGPHRTLQMCLRAPTQVTSVAQTPIQFTPHEHILPLGHRTQTYINTASDSWSCVLVLKANYSLNGGLQRPPAGSLYAMGKRKKKIKKNLLGSCFQVSMCLFVWRAAKSIRRMRMISESKVNTSDKSEARDGGARAGMKMLARAASSLAFPGAPVSAAAPFL